MKKPNIKKHIAIVLMAITLTIIITHFSYEITLMLITKFITLIYNTPELGKGTILDNAGVPMYDYGYIDGVYIGIQRNPVHISQQAFKYWDEFQNGNQKSKKLFLNCADWLIENAVSRDNYTVWEYSFPWPSRNLTSPWVSGMAQGQGLQVLIRAYDITGDIKYLKIANSTLQSFFIEVKNGGVTYKDTETGGWWYEEYPNPCDPKKEARVLNGFMFALLGLHEYYERTGNKDAEYLFKKGIVELKNRLPDYDTGEWTYYDLLGNYASVRYHHIHVELLDRLYKITHDPIFKEFYQKWKSYEDNPLLKYKYMSKKEKLVYPLNFFAIFILIEIIIFARTKVKRK